MTKQTGIRVLLADDHAVLRAGLRALLNAEPDIEVVGEAANGEEAVTQVAVLKPDIVVMDLTMPGMSGLDAIDHIVREHFDTQVLVLTMHAEEQYILRVLESGASGYVLKKQADEDLIAAIRQVYRGKPYLYPDATRILMEHYRHEETEQPTSRLELLSDREREVLELAAQGYTSREIGQMLHISHKTVDTYRQRLMEKLDLHHRVDLVQFALQHGLLTADE
jgi:two-component system response regulator NreC